MVRALLNLCVRVAKSSIYYCEYYGATIPRYEYDPA